MSVSVPHDCKKFRPAVVPMSIFIFAGGMLGAFCLVIITEGFHFNAVVWSVAAGLGAVFSVCWSCVIFLVYSAAFSAEGIYGHSFWGFRRFIGWQHIAEAKIFRVINLPFLRVYGTDGKVTWLALFQVTREEFCQEVRKFAPPNSPVLQYLP